MLALCSTMDILMRVKIEGQKNRLVITPGEKNDKGDQLLIPFFIKLFSSFIDCVKYQF